MSTSIADERRLLAAEEYEPVARSHYPALAGLGRDEVLELVRWLRERRGKFRGQIEHRRRVRRGKADARNTAAEPPSERGVAAKKQVFARALKRANARLDSVLAAEKIMRMTLTDDDQQRLIDEALADLDFGVLEGSTS